MPSPSHVLLGSSTSSANEFLIPILQEQGYTVSVATNQPDLVRLLTSGVDLLLLDLSSVDELPILTQARSVFAGAIIVIGPQRNTPLMIDAFENGADNFIQRPFRTDELLARIRAQLRRLQQSTAPVVRCGPLRVELHTRQIFFHDQLLDLTPMEYAVVAMLASAPVNKRLPNDILNQIWGARYRHDFDLLQTTIYQLRCAIEDEPTNPILLRGDLKQGYWLEQRNERRAAESNHETRRVARGDGASMQE